MRLPPVSSVAPAATDSRTCLSMSLTVCGEASGPTSVASSSGSPTFSASIWATNFLSNASAIFSCRMKRFAAMHDCPLLTMRALTAIFTASSRSADGITTNGSLPPSSSTLFLIRFAAVDATLAPAGSLPVSVAAFTRSSSSTRGT